MLLDTRPPEGGPEVQSTLKRGGIPEKNEGYWGQRGGGGSHFGFAGISASSYFPDINIVVGGGCGVM